MKTRPKWIVFDIGGVLLDWRGGLHSAGELLSVSDSELLEFLKIHLENLELGSMLEERFWELATKHFNSHENPYKVAQAWINGQPSIPAGWDLVEELKGKHQLAICTNNWLSVVENQVKRIEGFHNFEVIVDSSQEKTRKPEEKMFEIVENKINAKGDEIFFIDDSEQNIDAAKKYGWQAFLFDPEDEKGKISRNQIKKLLSE